MKLKNILLIIFVIGLLALVGCSNNITNTTGHAITEVDQLEKVSVRMPIPVIEAGQTPFYVAEDNGFFKENFLQPEFNLGSPELNPVKMVATGVDDFGVLGGIDTLLVARSKGQPLVAVAVIHKNSNFPVLLTLKESGITKMSQLEGKKVGMFYGHISTDVLRNLFKKTETNVQEIDVGFDYNPLITGQVDAEWAFTVTAGLNLPEKGIEVNTISPKDYGIITHGYTVFTTEKMIKENPEKVQRFVNALKKGIKKTLEDPNEAVKSLSKRDSKINENLELKRLKMYNAVTTQGTIGYMDEGMFQETYNRLVEEGVIKNKFDVKDAFTTQFIH